MPRTNHRRALEEASGLSLYDLLYEMRFKRHLLLSQMALELQVPYGTVGFWLADLGLTRKEVAEQAATSEAAS